MADTLKEESEFLRELGIEYNGAPEYDCDYLIPVKRDDELPFAPMLCNFPSHRISALEGEVIAEALDPYFSRTMGHFCGHKNTPHNKNSKRRAAIVKSKNAVYLAHPLAGQYYEFGSVYHKRYFMKALNCIYNGPPVKVFGLGSSGRIRTIKQDENKRYCINLTYATPSKRGEAEIVEDILPSTI